MSLNTDTTMQVVPAYGSYNNGGNFGWGDGSGLWWIIILFLFAINGWGGGLFGGGGTGATSNYVLASDMSMLSRQISDGFGSQERRTDSIINGLCDGFYTQAQLINGTNTAIMQGNNATQSQLASCCCDIREGIAGVNYNMATQANGISREIERGFCDSGYRDAMNTNQLMQSGHADADRIIAKLDAMEVAHKDERIAQQNQEIFQLQLRASQEAQNNYLVGKLGYQCPVAAYVVQPPQTVTFPQGCNCGGCNGTWA